MKALPLHHEFRDARYGLSDPSSLVGRELGDAEAVALAVVVAIDPSQRHAIGIPHHVAFGILPDEDPRRLKTAA